MISMRKVNNLFRKLMNNKTILSLALTVITVAEVSTSVCVIWVFGQEDMPDELI
jgi:cyclic lactone autoinducer peptide